MAKKLTEDKNNKMFDELKKKVGNESGKFVSSPPPMNNEELEKELIALFIDMHHPVGLVEFSDKLKDFILLDREKQKQRMKERLEGMKLNHYISRNMTRNKHYIQALDDILALLEE